ncbi:hypothetical protein CPB86DRAFT_792779 [Serendipita vermifera]|nr:hypothetical protein CPB86DRAFT_792779 [Serendipita vermifera]
MTIIIKYNRPYLSSCNPIDRRVDIYPSPQIAVIIKANRRAWAQIGINREKRGARDEQAERQTAFYLFWRLDEYVLPSQLIQVDKQWISYFAERIRARPVWITLFATHKHLGFSLDPSLAKWGVSTLTFHPLMPMFGAPSEPVAFSSGVPETPLPMPQDGAPATRSSVVPETPLPAPQDIGPATSLQFVVTLAPPVAEALPLPPVDTFINQTGAPRAPPVNEPKRKRRRRIVSKSQIENSSPLPWTPTPARAKQAARSKRPRVRKPRVQVIHRNVDGDVVQEDTTVEVATGGTVLVPGTDGDVTSDDEAVDDLLEDCLQEGQMVLGITKSPLKSNSEPTPSPSPKCHRALPDPIINLVQHERFAVATASLFSHEPEALRGYLSDFIYNVGSHYLRQNQSQDMAFSLTVRDAEGLPPSDALGEWENLIHDIHDYSSGSGTQSKVEIVDLNL